MMNIHLLQLKKKTLKSVEEMQSQHAWYKFIPLSCCQSYQPSTPKVSELQQVFWNIELIGCYLLAPQLAKLKKEKSDDSPLETAHQLRGSVRALRNKTNVLKDEQDSTITDKDASEGSQVKPEHVITKNDTEDSLREKFPGVNQFEFEFLMFLKSKSVSD